MAVKLYTIAQGDSLSFGVLLNVEYSISNITEAYIWLDGVKFSTTKVGQMFRAVLTSSDTYKHIGSLHVILDILDVNLGRKKIELGHLIVNQTNDFTKDASVNSGYDFVTNLTLTTTSVEVGDTITDYIKGNDGNGIESITLLSTVGLVKTYRITYTDATTFDYTVTDGVNGTNGVDGNDGNGIASITLLSTVGLVKTYRILFTDATTFDYDVTDGADGEANNTILHENEIPTGLVNGVNAEFTLLNDCIAVSSFMVNSVPVTSYTRIGKVITLSFAPSIGSTVHCTYFENVTTTQDISEKQDKTDLSLATTDKTVVGSINEVRSTANGKENIGIAQSLITQLINGAASGYDTLKELEDKIIAINSIIGGSAPDGDSIVNTVAELLAVFATFPEGSDMVTLLTAKLNTSDVYNALDQLLAGKALDARQGKVLNDLCTGLRTDLTNHNHAGVYEPVISKSSGILSWSGSAWAWISSTISDGWSAASSWVATNGTNILNHISSTSNPHSTTYSQVGAAPTIHTHSGQSINPDNVIINKTYTDAEAVSLAIGAVFYNSDQTDWQLKTSADTYYNIGGEVSPLMKNGDSFTHLNGQPVYVFNGNGKLPVVKLADASTELESYTIALATQDVLNTGNSRGRYCSFGTINGVAIANVIQTGESNSLWIEGVQLFLSTETGKLTTVAPIAPNHRVLVGYITDKSGANISIFVHPNVGAELGELHDVDLTKSKTTPIDADYILIQDSADSNIWKKLSWSNIKSTLQSTFAKLSGGNSFLGTQSITNSNADNTTKVLEINNFNGVLKSSINGNGNYESIPDYGAEGAPTFAIGDWTLTSGWEATNAGGTALDKSTAGATTATAIGGLTPVSGSVYRVSFTVADSIAGGAFVSGFSSTFGGNNNQTVSAVGIYTFIIRANNTNKLVFTPSASGSRFSIPAISIQPITTSVGQLKVGGDLIFGSRMLNSNGVEVMYVYPNGDVAFPISTIRPNAMSGGAVTSTSTITGRQIATTTGTAATTTGAVTMTLSTNGNYYLSAALTGTITVTTSAPATGAKSHLFFTQGATAQIVNIAQSGVTFRQTGTTNTGSGTIALQNISTVNANYKVMLDWATTTLCYITVM